MGDVGGSTTGLVETGRQEGIREGSHTTEDPEGSLSGFCVWQKEGQPGWKVSVRGGSGDNSGPAG